LPVHTLTFDGTECTYLCWSAVNKPLRASVTVISCLMWRYKEKQATSRIWLICSFCSVFSFLVIILSCFIFWVVW